MKINKLTSTLKDVNKSKKDIDVFSKTSKNIKRLLWSIISSINISNSIYYIIKYNSVINFHLHRRILPWSHSASSPASPPNADSTTTIPYCSSSTAIAFPSCLPMFCWCQSRTKCSSCPPGSWSGIDTTTPCFCSTLAPPRPPSPAPPSASSATPRSPPPCCLSYFSCCSQSSSNFSTSLQKVSNWICASQFSSHIPCFPPSTWLNFPRFAPTRKSWH